MPTGIYIRTPEYRINMGNAMRGKKRSEEVKLRMKHVWEEQKIKFKGKHFNPKYEFKKGNIGYWLGKKRSPETIEKMRIANQGKHRSPSTEFKKGYNSGEKSTFWKHGRSKDRDYLWRLRRDYELRKINAEGSHTRGEWELLKKQYGFKCPACQKIEPEILLTEDHIIPLSKGGSDYIENIQPLCRSCNSTKRLKTTRYSLEIRIDA